MDEFFASTSDVQEKILQEKITEVHIQGAAQLSINYIRIKVESLLSMAYCEMQKQFGHVRAAIKKERSENPQAAKIIKDMLSNIHRISKKEKRRLDYFLLIHKAMINALIGPGIDAERTTAASEHVLKAHAHESGMKMARMMFRGLEELADAVYGASVEIAKINDMKKAAEVDKSTANAGSIK